MIAGRAKCYILSQSLVPKPVEGNSNSGRSVSFGVFEMDLRAGELRKQGIKIKLPHQPFQILTMLLEHPGEVVAREQLRQKLWPADTFVDFDVGLNSAVKKLRDALGDTAETPRFVETLPRRGYRFITAVEVGDGGSLVRLEPAAAVAAEAPEGVPEKATPAVAAPSSRRLRQRWLWGTALGLALLASTVGLNVWGVRSRLLGRPKAGHIQSIAVLPLENLSNDPSQEYFADGMTEALISNLAQIRALSRVISRTSVMRYKGSRKSLPEIAQELNVDAVIEGTVQRSGGRVRVTAKLIPAATDSPLWARDYERDLSDVLKLQSDVARAIADEIRIQVTPEERARLAAARNINPQAHEAYLLGRHHLRTNEEDLRQAIGHFERAIQLAPDYAAAYAGLSNAWLQRGTWGTKNQKEVAPLAHDNALKAVALDPQLAEAHVALGLVKIFDWDWAGTEQEITRALELDPNSAEAHRTYGELLSALERHAEAIREMQRAEELDPLSSVIQSRYARALWRARKYEEAVLHVQRAIDLDPNPGNVMPYWILGDLYAEMGRYDEAIASLKKAQSHGGNALGISSDVAGVYARMGKQKEARRMLAELKATTDPASFSNLAAAYAYTALGDKDEAFKVLFRLVEGRNSYATYIRAEPPFDSLHSDPRWKELLRRIGLPP